jgi:hypothetical protein
MPKFFFLVLMTAAVALAPSSAFAYVGPGAGLSALGSLVSLLAAAGLAVLGFVWYPIRRLLRRIRGGKQPAGK